MGDNDHHKCHCHSSRCGELAGPLWIGGWLFTIGFPEADAREGFYALLLGPTTWGRTSARRSDRGPPALPNETPRRVGPAGGRVSRGRERGSALPRPLAVTLPGYAASAASRHFMALRSFRLLQHVGDAHLGPAPCRAVA